MHLSDAVLESVMVFRLGAGAVAEVVDPYIYTITTVLYSTVQSTVHFCILYSYEHTVRTVRTVQHTVALL